MSKFSNIKSINNFKTQHKDKQLIKESNDNIIGAIDEKNNLFILNPNYILTIGYELKNNYDSLKITNRHNTGIKISNDDIKILKSNSEEKSLSEIIKSIVDDKINSIDLQKNEKNKYSDFKAINACDGKINSKSVNNCKVDDNKITNKNLLTANKISNELSNKSDKNHTHSLEDINNLPLSNLISKTELTTLINETNNNINLQINQLHNELSNKSNIEHDHKIYLTSYKSLLKEIERIKYELESKSELNHEHSDLAFNISNKPTFQDLNEFFDYCKQNFIDIDEFSKKILKKSEINHNHTENSITNLDKYSKSQVDNLLNKKSKLNHSHKAEQILNPEDIYSDKNVINVINNFIDREILITKKNIQNQLDNKSDLNHSHNIDNSIDEIFNKLKAKLRDYLKENFTAKNSNLLDNQPAQNFAVVNHTHNFQNLSNKSHTHKESDISNLNKYTKKEIDNLIDNKSPKKHKHHISDITNLPKNYTNSDVRNLINKEYLIDTTISPETIYSSSKIDTLINSKAPAKHEHTLDQIKNIKGYIERTVDITVENNKHSHSFLDLQDKPKVYNDRRIKEIVTAQIDDSNISNDSLWSSSKIRHEFEVLHSIIKDKLK